MVKKKRVRYKVKVFTKMKDPFSLLYSGGSRSFELNGRLTKKQALSTIKYMKMVYPHHYKYRVKRVRK